MRQGTKLLIELGPLLAYFAANWFGGFRIATAVFMAAMAISVAASWLLTRKLSPMLLVSAVFVGIFGGLAYAFDDPTFIQMKVTLLNALFGAILLGGLAFGRSYLKLVMDTAMHMPDSAWRTLTIRWGLFFISLAALNEVLRNILDWDHWLAFKTFGLLSLTLVFALANAPFMAKHMIEDEAKPPA